MFRAGPQEVPGRYPAELDSTESEAPGPQANPVVRLADSSSARERSRSQCLDQSTPSEQRVQQAARAIPEFQAVPFHLVPLEPPS